MSNRYKTYNPKLYNHAFDLAFEVKNSPYEDGYKCLEEEKEKIKEALMKRVYSIFSDSNEYLEALGCFDTFCEDEDE